MREFFKRIDAMLAQHKMPTEYETWVSHVLCNDCEGKTWSKFHFLYHKCADCGSYNTKVIKSCERGDVEGEIYVQMPGEPARNEVCDAEEVAEGEEEAAVGGDGMDISSPVQSAADDVMSE